MRYEFILHLAQRTNAACGGDKINSLLKSDAGQVLVQGPLVSESLLAGIVTIDGKMISTSKDSTSALILTSDANSVIVEGNLTATKLSGEGNAYACIDSHGSFFRSDTPCK